MVVPMTKRKDTVCKIREPECSSLQFKCTWKMHDGPWWCNYFKLGLISGIVKMLLIRQAKRQEKIFRKGSVVQITYRQSLRRFWTCIFRNVILTV